MRGRVRAPALRGRGWLGTGGRDVGPAQLRGRVVLLDFWTAGCVNCLRVLDELAALEERFGDALVVLGVHSPKFAHEARPEAVAAAVGRYGVRHPVLDDADLVTWDAYAVRAWPTLVLIDPDGYVVAQVSGEGHGAALAGLVEGLLTRGGSTVRRGPLFAGAPDVPEEPAVATALEFSEKALRFPAKAAVLPGGTLLVADPGHHRLVELDADLVTVRRTIGDGHRGWVDGPAGVARFAEPLGVAVRPGEVAAAAGYDVVVADAANHLLRGVRLDDGAVSTVAGTGAQRRGRVSVGTVAAARAAALSTPWDVAWWRDRVVVAMAGSHQLWAFEPVGGTVTVLAGRGDEGLRDGRPVEAFLAQPSGLASGPDGTLWVADAESSALRAVVAEPELFVSTAVGEGLFDFGYRDGAAFPPDGSDGALLQHPSGVAVLPDGSVAIADTYNGAVRRYDPATRRVGTLADGLAEPAAVVDGGDGTLVVVESAAHRLVRVPLPAGVVAGRAGPHAVTAVVAPGPVTLRVRFVPPPGRYLDRRFGDPTALTVDAPDGVLASGIGGGPGLARALEVRHGGPVQVEAVAAACDGPPGEAGVFAACHRYYGRWTVALRTEPGAPAELVLDLAAT